jgi:hypothetical protein
VIPHALDAVFWWIGAIVCTAGSVTMTLAVLWWCFDTTMTQLGLTRRFLTAYREVLLAKQGARDE